VLVDLELKMKTYPIRGQKMGSSTVAQHKGKPLSGIQVNKLEGDDLRFFNAVRECLSPDLLDEVWRKKWKKTDHKVKGHCFVATHACYHLFGKDKCYIPRVCKLTGGGTHWWLYNSKLRQAIDPTIEQVVTNFPYDAGHPCVVYVKRHDKEIVVARPKMLVEKVQNYLEAKHK
jgi:hypothetical protein